MDHSQHGGGDTTDGCPMIMNFHNGHCEMILFPAWTVKEIGGFLGSALAIYLFAILYEGLKYFREKILADQEEKYLCSRDKDTQQMVAPTRKQFVDQIFDKAHIIQTLLHLLQVIMSYILMLIVMIYNVWLCLVVVLGAATGYWLFGWIRHRAVDVTEHCH